MESAAIGVTPGYDARRIMVVRIGETRALPSQFCFHERMNSRNDK
jgi:hypothetical protein